MKDAVDKAKSDADFPDDLPADPNVFEMNFSELMPVMNINLSGDFSPELLKDYAEIIEDRVEDLPQITKVDIRGIQEKEVLLLFLRLQNHQQELRHSMMLLLTEAEKVF